MRTAKTTPRPPGPSFSGPSGQNRRNSYLSLILAQIRKKRYYPLLARRRGYQGRVGLWLTISPEGQLLSVKIFQGSGHRILDRAALKIVQRAAPFPPPPPELGPWPLKIKIFLKFYLTK
ncbi:energy transducer TonB [Thermosulfurimonas sp.]|uniref:energy transducer TonB n=1 Tax=Thermosulfurimonas sp. TaxID=2080236 RepID=UPI0034479570